MPCDKIKVVSLVIENMVYVTMVGLGIFLIFHGDVVHKFQLRRTNFAIYEEDIFELPNIVTYIWPMKNFTLGKDFSIFFRSVYSFRYPSIDLSREVTRAAPPRTLKRYLLKFLPN